jgi:hypothetical protein
MHSIRTSSFAANSCHISVVVVSVVSAGRCAPDGC